MAEEGFLQDLIKKSGEGDDNARRILTSLKRTLDSISSENLTKKQKFTSSENSTESNIQTKENISDKKTDCNQFKCDVCGKIFKNKRSLMRHFRIHSSKKEKCEFCGKQFSRKDNLNQHKKRMHVDNKSETVNHLEASVKSPPLMMGSQNIALPIAGTSQVCSPVAGTSQVCSPVAGTSQVCSAVAETSKSHTPIPGISKDYSHVNEPSKICSINKDAAAGGINTTIKLDTNQSQIGGRTFHDTHRHQFSDVSSLNGAANTRNYYPNDYDENDLLTFFGSLKIELMKHIKDRRLELKNLKWYLCSEVEVEKETNGGKVQAYPHLRSISYVLLSSEELSEHDLNEALQKIFSAFEEFMREGSNWVLKRVIKLEVNTVPYSPLGGSSYIPTPISFHNGILNIMNMDQKCFLWSVLASLHPVTDIAAERVVHYTEFEHELDMSGIDYPVTIASVSKFEKQNNISVNVFGIEENEIFPMYTTKVKEAIHHVNLLCLTNDKKSHYCLITNLNYFLARTKSNKKQHFFCHFCMQGFTRQDILNDHIAYCSKYDAQNVQYPSDLENILEFKSYEKKLKVPFCIYADFECFARKIDTCLPDPAKSSTTNKTMFEACSFGYKVVCTDDRYTKPTVIYRGPNVTETFLRKLVEEEMHIKNILNNIEPLDMSDENERDFRNSTECYICEKPFHSRTIKVRDHCHLTGKFRGASCQHCNLNYKYPTFIPVVLHNLKNFDSHLIAESLGMFKEKNIKCIPINMEKYIGFSLGNLRFIDSFQFMSQSLEELTKNLARNGLSKFRYFTDEFSDETKAKLLLRKGVYPYEYVVNQEKFKDTILPVKDDFYSQLSKSHISDRDYQHAQNVWKTLSIKNMGEYHDVYLKTDVLLLADVFENFRKMCVDYYGLDCLHFYTSPGLAWNAALKMTKVCLELITNPDMYLFFETAVRGGVSMISTKYSKANNPHVAETYDETKPTKYILYTDCNNLYGKAMMEPLPLGFFCWVEDVNNFNVQAIPSDSDNGYVLEVDLEYPDELHDLHSDYPLAPENLAISDFELSNYSKELWKELNPNSKHTNKKLCNRIKAKKLIPTLKQKSKYILHYRNLQLCLNLGMEVTKIHRILEFYQRPWLKQYIEFNSQKRKEAMNDFEKDFFKLMNNAVFGKTMENVRNRVDIKLIHTEKKLKKYTAKPSFQRLKIFNENLVAVENCKTKLVLNKPIYIGQCILDLSKMIMQDFHYNYIKQKYGNNAKLLFTDTDSLCYEIQTDNIYDDISADSHLFDLSNYSTDHPAYNAINKKIPGCFKDETGGKPIKEFVGLRSKMYSFTYGEEQKQVAKGIARATIKNDLRHDMYKECLFNKTIRMCQMYSIRSDKHQMHVQAINKIGLTAFDDKRYVLDNGFDTLAFGHYMTEYLDTETD